MTMPITVTTARTPPMAIPTISPVAKLDIEEKRSEDFVGDR